MKAFLLGVGFTLVAVPSALIAALYFGWLQSNATAEPPAWEEMLGDEALDLSIERNAPHVPNPTKMSDQELLAGLKLYMDNCAGCHGSGKHQSSWGAKNFYPRVPQFGLASPDQRDFQMFWIVKYGVRYSAMGGWDGVLPDEDLWRIVTFLVRMDSLPQDVEAKWMEQSD